MVNHHIYLLIEIAENHHHIIEDVDDHQYHHHVIILRKDVWEIVIVIEEDIIYSWQSSLLPDVNIKKTNRFCTSAKIKGMIVFMILFFMAA